MAEPDDDGRVRPMIPDEETALNELLARRAAEDEVIELFGDLALLERTVEPAPEPTTEDLTSVAAIGRYMKEVAKAIVESDAHTAALRDEFKRIAEKVLPDLLSKIGLKDFTLLDGSVVTVESAMHASITKANQDDAFSYLVETGADDLIKTVVKVEFGKGELGLAAAFQNALTGRWPKRKVSVAQSVHPQTLAAYLRELDKGKTPFPEDIFGVHRVTQAVIREPGAKAKGSKPNKPTDDEEL